MTAPAPDYTMTIEWVGAAQPRLVVRLHGEWVGEFASRAEADAAMAEQAALCPDWCDHGHEELAAEDRGRAVHRSAAIDDGDVSCHLEESVYRAEHDIGESGGVELALQIGSTQSIRVNGLVQAQQVIEVLTRAVSLLESAPKSEPSVL